MTICPIALIASCKKCLLVKVCPLKGVIGDHKKPDDSQPTEDDAPSKGDTEK